MRIWLARARASIRWFSERSGAVAGLEGVVPVAVVMGGESTRHRLPIKPKRPNSPRPQLEVKIRRGWSTVWCRFAGVLLHPQRASARVGVAPRGGPARLPETAEKYLRLLTTARREPAVRGRSCARGGVAEGLGPDRHEGRADLQQLARVGARLDPAHPDHGDLHARRRRPPPGPARPPAPPGPRARPCPPPSHGRARAPLRGRGQRHRAQRVDQRDGVRSPLLGGQRAGAARRPRWG